MHDRLIVHFDRPDVHVPPFEGRPVIPPIQALSAIRLAPPHLSELSLPVAIPLHYPGHARNTLDPPLASGLLMKILPHAIKQQLFGAEWTCMEHNQTRYPDCPAVHSNSE